MAKPITKPGKYGPLYRYAITYTDVDDPCCPHFVTCLWAYSWEHASEKFFDTDEDGWMIVSWSRMSEAPPHRWPVHHA